LETIHAGVFALGVALGGMHTTMHTTSALGTQSALESGEGIVSQSHERRREILWLSKSTRSEKELAATD